MAAQAFLQKMAANAERGLRQIIRAEAEELRGLRDLVGGERAARRRKNHRAFPVALFVI